MGGRMIKQLVVNGLLYALSTLHAWRYYKAWGTSLKYARDVVRITYISEAMKWTQREYDGAALIMHTMYPDDFEKHVRHINRHASTGFDIFPFNKTEEIADSEQPATDKQTGPDATV
jgi:hypothetical protein